MAEAELRLLLVETKQLLKLRQGPFQSSSYHSVILQASMEMLETTTWEGNLIFIVLYPSIAADFSMRSSGLGSDDHIKAVWFRMREVLLSRGKGDNTKSGRWWNYDENSAQFMSSRSALLCVLCWVGLRRGWWRSFHECPLTRSASGACPEQGENIGVSGLEGLDDGNGEGEVEAGPRTCLWGACRRPLRGQRRRNADRRV